MVLRLRHKAAIPTNAPMAVRKLHSNIPLTKLESVSRKVLSGESMPVQKAANFLPARRNSKTGCDLMKEVANCHFSCM
jgi:hypothetical protein